jgi:hypothetical protein
VSTAWGVAADLVDDAFYRSVMSAGAFDYYFHVKRFKSLTQPLDENRDRMRARSEIIHLSDKNPAFQNKSKLHYSLLLPSGQELAAAYHGMKEMDDLIHFRQVSCRSRRLRHLKPLLCGVQRCGAEGVQELFKVEALRGRSQDSAVDEGGV